MNDTDNNTVRKICLLGVAFDTNNLGVGVLIAGLVKCARHAFPQSEIFVLDYARAPQTFRTVVDKTVVPVALVNMRFSRKLFQWNNIVVLLLLAALTRVLPAAIRKGIVQRNDCLRAIRDADIIGSIAGGDSFSDIYGMERLLYVTLPQILVLLCGKPLVQLPQTFGPYKGTAARAIARTILSRSTVVLSRDRNGLDVVNRLVRADGRRVAARFMYDVGFVVDPAPPHNASRLTYLDKTEAAPPLVGFNVSGLLYMGGYTRRNMFHLKIDYPAFVHTMIRRFIDTLGARVVLIPHVFGAVESDADACMRTFNELHKDYPATLFVVDERLDQHETKYVIGACDFFTGARMHACIAALSQHIPAAAIAYSSKFMGVMESIGMGSLVVDPCANTLEECVERVAQLFTERYALSRSLATKMPVVRSEILALFAMIRQERQQPRAVGSHGPVIGPQPGW
jgi:colanic acid/amylovoran biosynthesis protein